MMSYAAQPAFAGYYPAKYSKRNTKMVVQLVD